MFARVTCFCCNTNPEPRMRFRSPVLVLLALTLFVPACQTSYNFV